MIDLELSEDVKYMIQEKIRWRENYAQDLSILRLDYIFKVLRSIYKNKATIADPEAFKYKIKAMLRAQRRAKRIRLNRSDSKSSFASMYSKSQKTGISEATSSAKSSNAGSELDEDDEYDDDDEMTFATDAIRNDPVMVALSNLFDTMTEHIENSAEQRLYA